jgi:predicted transglutaminase-like cysteine proteinase
MRNNVNYSYFSVSAALLLAAAMLAGTTVAAQAVAPAEPAKLEPDAFMGGLPIERQTSGRVVKAPAAYVVYDAEAIGRHLRPAAEEAGIDPVQTAGIVPGAFRSVAIPMKNFPVSARWAPIYRAISGCAGNACGQGNKAFAKMVASARHAGFLSKLERVNRGVNGMIAYRGDKAVYGSLDHWAKPAEILNRGAGDCEDFAILKMAALIDAGIPAKSMSLVVLQDSQKGVFHAVLSVATGSGIFILDNVRNNVVKDTNLPSYVPLYSFSTNRAWIHGSKTGGSQVASAKGGFASIAPGEGPQPAAPKRPRRPGWMPAAGS